MPTSTISASSTWLSRLRRRKQNASMPSGRNASIVLPAAVRSSEVFVPSGRFAGVETERIAVDAEVPDIVMLGGNIVQLTYTGLCVVQPNVTVPLKPRIGLMEMAAVSGYAEFWPGAACRPRPLGVTPGTIISGPVFEVRLTSG